MLLSRIDFNADLEPAFYFNEDPDPKQIYADLSPNQTLLLQTVEFYMKNTLM